MKWRNTFIYEMSLEIFWINKIFSKSLDKKNRSANILKTVIKHLSIHSDWKYIKQGMFYTDP